jgi:hypothetical protein
VDRPKESAYTTYVNTGTTDVNIRQIAVFLSSLEHYVTIQHKLNIHVTRKGGGATMTLDKAMPTHRHGVNAEMPTILAVDISLQPGDTLAVTHIAHAEEETWVDFAAYILSDAAEGQLQVCDELELWPTRLDLNGDGWWDRWNFDNSGRIFWNPTEADGSHDTQQMIFQSVFVPSELVLDPSLGPAAAVSPDGHVLRIAPAATDPLTEPLVEPTQGAGASGVIRLFCGAPPCPDHGGLFMQLYGWKNSTWECENFFWDDTAKNRVRHSTCGRWSPSSVCVLVTLLGLGLGISVKVIRKICS